MYSQYVSELQQLYSLNQECKNVAKEEVQYNFSITTVHHNYFNFKMPNVIQVTCRNCLIGADVVQLDRRP